MAESAICKINYNWSGDCKFIILGVKCKYLPSSWWIFAINSKYNLYFLIYIYIYRVIQKINNLIKMLMTRQHNAVKELFEIDYILYIID